MLHGRVSRCCEGSQMSERVPSRVVSVLGQQRSKEFRTRTVYMATLRWTFFLSVPRLWALVGLHPRRALEARTQCRRGSQTWRVIPSPPQFFPAHGSTTCRFPDLFPCEK